MLKILVGVNKSEESQLALRYACHLLEHFPAEVDALYVKPDIVEMAQEGAYAPFATKDDMEREVEKEATRVVEEIFEACEVCLGGKVPCEPMVAIGDPAEEILREADEGQYDLVVLGGPSRSTLRGLLLGAVHNKVLHYARQPVFIVRNYREIKRLLVAYRGSSCDQGALEFIGPLFAKNKPEITVLHVQETERGESSEFAETCVLVGRETLRRLDFEPVIKVRRDASSRAGGCMPRKLAAQEYLRDPEAWKRRHGYGQRWMVETVFSSLKRTFGEYVSAKTMHNMANEIMLKASLYNLFTGLSVNP